MSASTSTSPTASPTATTTITTTTTTTTIHDWQTLLSNREYDIEFHGYLTNHVKHAMIALHRLDASPDRIQEYWNQYTSLTPYNINIELVPKPWNHVEPLVSTMTELEFLELRGKKVQFQEQCLFLQQELQERFHHDMTQLIKHYVPSLLPGLAGALTHGIIHLGWALDASNEWMTIEGLAYLNFCNVGMPPNSLVVDLNNHETSALESLIRISKQYHDQDLATSWIASTKGKYKKEEGNFHPELIPAGFQWELAKVLHHPHEIATHLPAWLQEMSLNQLWEELYRLVTLLYLATRQPNEPPQPKENDEESSEKHGNFVVLHLITSLWALEQVTKVMDNEETSRDALKHFYSVMICLLATSSSGFPSVQDITETSKQYPMDDTDNSEFNNNNDNPNDKSGNEDTLWSPIVSKAILEVEEHNMKLVYVTRELWKRYNTWKGFRHAADSFTLTPNIGPAGF